MTDKKEKDMKEEKTKKNGVYVAKVSKIYTKTLIIQASDEDEAEDMITTALDYDEIRFPEDNFVGYVIDTDKIEEDLDLTKEENLIKIQEYIENNTDLMEEGVPYQSLLQGKLKREDVDDGLWVDGSWDLGWEDDEDEENEEEERINRELLNRLN